MVELEAEPGVALALEVLAERQARPDLPVLHKATAKVGLGAGLEAEPGVVLAPEAAAGVTADRMG